MGFMVTIYPVTFVITPAASHHLYETDFRFKLFSVGVVLTYPLPALNLASVG